MNRPQCLGLFHRRRRTIDQAQRNNAILSDLLVGRTVVTGLPNVDPSLTAGGGGIYTSIDDGGSWSSKRELQVGANLRVARLWLTMVLTTSTVGLRGFRESSPHFRQMKSRCEYCPRTWCCGQRVGRTECAAWSVYATELNARLLFWEQRVRS